MRVSTDTAARRKKSQEGAGGGGLLCGLENICRERVESLRAVRNVSLIVGRRRLLKFIRGKKYVIIRERKKNVVEINNIFFSPTNAWWLPRVTV